MGALATLDGYEVLRPLGHGADGIRYLARDAAGEEVELWRLRRIDEARSREIERRIDALMGVTATALRRVHRASLTGDVPYVVVERVRPLPELGYDTTSASEIVGALAHALSEAHRLGFVHGAIDRRNVSIGANDGPRIDLLALSVYEPLGDAARAPERQREGIATTAGDVYGLGALFASLLGVDAQPTTGMDSTEADVDRDVRALIGEMCAMDPDQRPSASDVADALLAAAVVTDETGPLDRTRRPKIPEKGSRVDVGSKLGRFELLEAIGEGGMGRVFKGRDGVSGEEVAIKVLSHARASDELSVRRFKREARVLSRVDSPSIAHFVEANEDDGVLYLAMELVEGRSLKEALTADGAMAVEVAIDIAIEICRGLADVHDLGVVHRDVKPSNVLLAPPGDETGPMRVKLCDFGIARAVAEGEETGITRAGMAPGTPWYMSPEQCRAEQVDVRADIYALGATLFHALAGEPPFPAREQALVISAHLTEAPPDVRSLRPDVDVAVAAVVARALEKEPDKRYASGRDMLADLERARHGERASIDLHPLPSSQGAQPSKYRFEWRLNSSREELWPYVSDTERFNRAVGLSAVEFSHQSNEHGVETSARQSGALGMVLEWREHPFEWIAPRRLGVLREHSTGPFAWIRSTVDLERDRRGGTKLVHTLEVAPRGPLGRAAASLEIGVRLRRAFGRVYQRIDETCALAAAAATALGRARVEDPFEDKPRLSVLAHQRLGDVASRLLTRGNAPRVVEALVEHIREGTPQEVAQIRPLALAARMGVEGDAMLRACLWATQEGSLELLWDIICPACRIPSSIVETLAQLKEHAHCDACDVDFELDLARSVELVFRVHPRIRQSDSATYCIGGPANSPHVLAQVRLAPGERFQLDPELAEGGYRLAGRWSERTWGFRVAAHAPHDEWHLRLGAGLSDGVARSLRPGSSRILLENDLGHEAVVRLERSDGRADAFTAADAASHPLFRELFPTEVLSPDQLVGVSHIAIVVAETADPSRLYREGRDGRAFRELLELREHVERRAAVEGGTLVKLFGHGVLAVFTDNRAALRAALALHSEIAATRVVAHAGPAMMTTIDGRLDYFGRLIHEAQVFSANVTPGELLVSEALIIDSEIAALFAAEAPGATVFVKDGMLANRVASIADVAE